MGFCTNCGFALAEGVKFCGACGTAVGEREAETSKRKILYDGELHKCSNCGELVDSFKSHCSSCGYEFRNLHSISSARDLAIKLEEIEAQKMPHIESKKSLIKSVFGRDFKDVDEVAEAQKRFDRQKGEQKSNIIVNFPVPNTKEDILEFMILVSSNINMKKELNDEETKAWISKLEQIYEKAQLVMGDTPHFYKINKIYTEKKRQIRILKIKSGLIFYVYFAFVFVLFYSLLLWHYTIATVGVTIGVVVLAFVGNKLFKKYLKQ